MFPWKVLPVPQPLTISWVWKPSSGEWIPVLPRISQPLLLLLVHDYLFESTSRALQSAPPGTRVIEVPLEPAGVAAPTGLYSYTPEVIAGPLSDFID